MSSLLIKHGRLIDPASGTDSLGDLLIRDGLIAVLGKVSSAADLTIDATGLLVTPGLIDMHTHLREPGNEQAETILSGCRAGVCGGFSAIAAMPNTTPCTDNGELVRLVLDKARRADLCRVLVVGAISRGRAGQELADLAGMAQAGAVAFSDDGDCVRTAELMRKAIAEVADLNLAIIQHCEDPEQGRGDVNAGPVAEATGLSGSSGQTEAEILVRDMELLGASVSPCRYHVAHVSAAETVRILDLAKSQGLSITAEAAPHHLALTDELCRGKNPLYKVRPPLRSAADVVQLKAAVAKGTIDCLACDHAPHTAQSKAREFSAAPAGVLGLETALAVYITELIEPGLLTWLELIEKLTVNPAAVLSLQQGRLTVGGDADITVIDPVRKWTVQPEKFRSLSRNCPFAGRTLTGKAVATIVAGRVRYLGQLAVAGELPTDIIRD